MAEIEKSKELPKKIYKRKAKKRPGVTFITKDNINAKNSDDNKEDNNKEKTEEEKAAEEKREAFKKSLEDQLEKKRSEFIDALLPYANELKDVDEKVVDDVLNQLADSLADAIDEGTDSNAKAKVADVDFEVVTKEKLKAWLEKNEEKISSKDDMKFEVVLLDKNGKRYEVSNSDTDVDNIMDFLKGFSSDSTKTVNLADLKEELKKKAQENVEEVGGEENGKEETKKEDSTSNQEKKNKDEL